MLRYWDSVACLSSCIVSPRLQVHKRDCSDAFYQHGNATKAIGEGAEGCMLPPCALRVFQWHSLLAPPRRNMEGQGSSNEGCRAQTENHAAISDFKLHEIASLLHRTDLKSSPSLAKKDARVTINLPVWRVFSTLFYQFMKKQQQGHHCSPL